MATLNRRPFISLSTSDLNWTTQVLTDGYRFGPPLMQNSPISAAFSCQFWTPWIVHFARLEAFAALFSKERHRSKVTTPIILQCTIPSALRMDGTPSSILQSIVLCFIWLLTRAHAPLHTEQTPTCFWTTKFGSK